MKDETPKVIIEGTTFLFDIDKIILVEKENQNNRIYFSSMRDFGTHYEFDYSKVDKNFHHFHSPHKSSETGLSKERATPKDDPLVTVRIPSIGEIDPEGMCRKYGCTQKDLDEKSDFEIMVDQDIFIDRTDGKPVVIDLAGKKYDIDVPNNALRPQEGLGDTIYLNALYDYFSSDHEAFQLLYDTKAFKIEDPLKDGDIENKHDLVIVEIPTLSDLDPIGTNMRYGVSPDYGLMYRSLKMEHSARSIPWGEYQKTVEKHRHPAFLNINANPPKRELPIENIEGTDFIVDVMKFELREKANESNIITFDKLYDEDNGYAFEYDLSEKNTPQLFSNNPTTTVWIPEFVELDPLGMAQKYGLTPEEIKGKTDFDVMVDQYAYDMRLNKGRLPTLDIAGHLFYVDLRMGMLRPKDDFFSKGIVFDDIEEYFSEERNMYLITYDPKKHEFRELDYENLLSVPKDLIAVEFPFQRQLDPIGWNRQLGWDIKDSLKIIGIKSHFQAKHIPWEQTYIYDIINSNKNKAKLKSEIQNKRAEPGKRQRRNKGRGM